VTNASPANHPVLRLQHVESDRTFFANATDWTGTTLISAAIGGLPTGHYRVSVITNGIPSVQKVVVLTLVPPGVPSNFVATATSPTSISLTWDAVPFATEYLIFRTIDDYTLVTDIGTFTGTATVDSGVTANKSYLYQLRAHNAAGVGLTTQYELATTVLFADDPIVVGTTTVAATHIAQLRTATNAVRAVAGMAPLTFTDPTLTPGATPIRAVHITEMQDGVTEARVFLSLPSPFFTENPTTGDTIKALHVNELRDRVK
jgi:hypothetical protein